MSEVYKALPTNITKENLLQAIQKIDSEGIPKNADSNYYDVLHEGKKYPPKVIVSYASFFANGEIIDRKTFPGGADTPCFKLLESNGFQIIKKELKLPFQIALYDIHGASAIGNYQTLKSPDNTIFLWDDSRFNKLNEGDYVFWVNRSLKEALFTKIASKNVTPIFSDGKNSMSFKGFTGKATAESPDRYKNFVGFEIIERCEIEDFWDYNDTSTFANQVMAINLLVIGTKIQELPKKIEKLKDLSRIFSDSDRASEIIQTALEILEEKAGAFLNTSPIKKEDLKDSAFITSFISAASSNNLYFPSYLAKRYVASLVTKPFVIFTGLSGSGKTKLAQTFAKWMCKSEDQYKIIPVGADWTNREPLLGYPNSLDPKNYVLPDNGALALVIEAAENANGKELKDCDPYFLILDEMNLSHVERYFADFLSAMESKEEIMLYSGEKRTTSNGLAIPEKIKLPPNLFIVGTVNIDETTYMFSPKVLDRANTIEFRLDEEDISSFFTTQIVSDPELIEGQGSHYAHELMQLAAKDFSGSFKEATSLLAFFGELQKLGAEFGYRTASEMIRLMHQLESLGMDAAQKESALDVAVMQKMLPKLHGSRSKLTKVLPVLASFCLKENSTEKAKQLLESYKNDRLINNEQKEEIILPLSFKKIARMYTNALENAFANYAEG